LLHSAACADTYNNATITAEAYGNTTTPVIISGDNLIYDNVTQEIFGRGHVLMRHSDMMIFADLIYVNPDTGDVSAEGNVLAEYSGSKIYTEKFYYNTKTENAYTRHANIISPPWILRGEKLKKEGDKTELETPVFTTCDAEKPHYRMEASMITLYGKERVEAWHVTVYLGTVPVMYFPYFTQSLQSNKDPFDFKFGRNDVDGWYANIKYFFFLKFLEQSNVNGTVGMDYYEKRGPAFNADLAYAIAPNSTGDLSGSYLQDKLSGLRRWWVSFNHDHVFSDTMRAGVRTRSASDSQLAKDFLSTDVDAFQHEYSGSFSATLFGSQSIAASVSDFENLNTITSKYVTSSRVLPTLSYSMTSLQILPHVYYSHSLNMTRTYIVGGADDYSYTGTLAPNLTLNTPQMIFATLSGNAALNSAWTKLSEKEKGWGQFINALNTSENLKLNVLPEGHMDLNLTHAYAKQMNKFDALLHSGITANNLTGRLTAGWGVFSCGASLAYDMLRDRNELWMQNNLDRLGLLNLNADFKHDAYYLSATSAISMYSSQVKNTSVSFSIADTGPKALWTIGAITGFINNKLDGLGHAVSLTAFDDSLTFSTAFSFGLTPDLRVSVYRYYDLMQKTLLEQKYSLTWYIHCWQADLSYSKRQDNAEEIFFTVAIAAVPEFRFSKPTSTMPDQFNMLGAMAQ
jgi:lipopolysaccharide assembly outer membrane protein LptD (OstA)